MEEDKPQILLWTAPGCPNRVTIPAPLINEIRILAVEAFYSVPRGGVEIGGVFFGNRESDTLAIQAHRPIPCQYSTGPSFTLSIKDQLGLSGILDQSAEDPDLDGLQPLGWYHSHTRSEIFLSPADLQLYSEFFPERWQIALVVRPTNLQATRGGFFFRDRSGVVKADAPSREFKLEPPNFGLEPLDTDAPTTAPADAPRQTPSPAIEVLEPVAAAPPDFRSAPLPEATPVPVLTPAFVALEPPATPMASVAVPEVPQAAALPGPEPIPFPIPQPIPQPEIVPEPRAPVDVAIPNFLAKEKVRNKRSTGWLWAMAAIVLLCGAGGATVLEWDRFVKPVDLGLETYDINGAFLIRWDRDSRVIRSATHVTLEIQDGGEKTPIELTPLELAVGGYGYMRRTGQVSVHFKVEGPISTEEYSNFNSAQSLGSQQTPTPATESGLAQALAEKEHLKTELINESMLSVALRKEITSLRHQLAEERAKATSPAQ